MTQNNTTYQTPPLPEDKPFSEMLRLRREKLHREFAGCILEEDFHTVSSTYGNCSGRTRDFTLKEKQLKKALYEQACKKGGSK